jgi:6,7-dimethyl-8-ribityllumazine synthase
VDAIVAFGVIIQGATAHAELIGRTVTEALMQISLETRVPVIHEVLLVQNEEQARERCLGDEINRGTEAARVAIRMALALGQLPRR